jgi:hypothetical protein
MELGETGIKNQRIYKVLDIRRTIKQVGLVPFWCAVVDFVFAELFVSHFFVLFNGFEAEFYGNNQRCAMLPVSIIFGKARHEGGTCR